MSLTTAAIRGLRPRGRPFKRFDERGLFLFVTPSGLKSWRWRFRRDGHEQLLVLGHWPEMSLDEARSAADAAREAVARGGDPRVQPGRPNNLGALALEWHADRSDRWTPAHAAEVLSSLERHVFPVLGGVAAADITARDVIALLKSIEAAGTRQTARRVRQRLEKIFDFAIARDWLVANPARAARGELASAPPARHHPAMTDAAELAALLARIDAIDAPPSARLAARFLALTAVRMAAVRGARWEEFEGLDGPTPLWRVPSERMKLARARKGDRAADHLVPLSAPAVAVLRAAAGVKNELVFPGAAGGPIGEGAIGALHRRAGADGRHVPHGWRASFSTILNEDFPDERFAIDAALGHTVKGQVEGAYNRSDQLARRRRLFDAWADRIAPAPQAGGPT